MSLVLLAEDDRRLSQLVGDYLNGHGFTTVVEESGTRVPIRVRDLSPDIVLLDIMLPGKDGLTICRELRDHYHGPILMLTARDTDADQVMGLEFGADDYVIKPAEPRVLLARIRALLRRYCDSAVPTDEPVAVGTLTINPAARSVTLSDDAIDLSSHEFDLLLTLVREADRVLSREYLFTTVYRRPYDGLDRTIDVRICQLRKKLGDNASKPERIKTIWGKGYLLVSGAW